MLLLWAGPTFAETPDAQIVEVRRIGDSVIVYLTLTTDRQMKLTLTDALLLDADGRTSEVWRNSGIHLDTSGSCANGTQFSEKMAQPITLGFVGTGAPPYSLSLELQAPADVNTCRRYELHLPGLQPR
jgi:hypothetical protein